MKKTKVSDHARLGELGGTVKAGRFSAPAVRHICSNATKDSQAPAERYILHANIFPARNLFQIMPHLRRSETLGSGFYKYVAPLGLGFGMVRLTGRSIVLFFLIGTSQSLPMNGFISCLK